MCYFKVQKSMTDNAFTDFIVWGPFFFFDAVRIRYSLRNIMTFVVFHNYSNVKSFVSMFMSKVFVQLYFQLFPHPRLKTTVRFNKSNKYKYKLNYNIEVSLVVHKLALKRLSYLRFFLRNVYHIFIRFGIIFA